MTKTFELRPEGAGTGCVSVVIFGSSAESVGAKHGIEEPNSLTFNGLHASE